MLAPHLMSCHEPTPKAPPWGIREDCRFTIYKQPKWGGAGRGSPLGTVLSRKRGAQHPCSQPSQPLQRPRTRQHVGRKKEISTEVPAHSRSSRNAGLTSSNQPPPHSCLVLIPGALRPTGAPGLRGPQGNTASFLPTPMCEERPCLHTSAPAAVCSPPRRAHWIWHSPGWICCFKIPSDATYPPFLPT